MLIVEIALGIVLGFVLLRYLYVVLSAVVILAVVVLLGALGIFGWQLATPYHEDIKQIFGILLSIGFLIALPIWLYKMARQAYLNVREFVTAFVQELRGPQGESTKDI